jgi:hypothetical protein
MAQQAEPVFRAILFTGVCLDLIGRIIPLSKLLIFPTSIYFFKKFFDSTSRLHQLIFETDDDTEQEKVITAKLMRQDMNDLKQHIAVVK